MHIDERVERLEKAIRRQQLGFGLLVLAGIAILTIGQFRPRHPNAPSADLNVSTLTDLSVSKLSVHDAAGRERIILAEGTILLIDENGTDRVALFTNQNHIAQLKFFDSKGIPRIVTGIEAEDDAFTAFYEPSGPVRIGTGVDAQGDASILINDSKGTRRYGIGTDGEDVLEVFCDRKGVPLINTGVSEGKASFKLFDEHGQALFERP